MIFRELNPQVEQEFREYARENDPLDINNWEAYHPICREEWIKRGIKPLIDNPLIDNS
jgi:hypothetical protein